MIHLAPLQLLAHKHVSQIHQSRDPSYSRSPYTLLHFQENS